MIDGLERLIVAYDAAANLLIHLRCACSMLSRLRQAFRDLALLHHPDKGLQNCDDTCLALKLLLDLLCALN